MLDTFHISMGCDVYSVPFILSSNWDNIADICIASLQYPLVKSSVLYPLLDF